MTWVPEACTLPTVDQPLRLREFEELFALAVRPADRVTSSALRLHLPPGDQTLSAARDLVVRETGCCSFFSFELRQLPTETELDVRVPLTQTAVLDAMEQHAEAARLNASGR